MNTWLIFGPLGAILIGVLSIRIWSLKKQVGIRYFAFGGLVWFAAFIPKLVLDSTLTPELNAWSTTTYGFIGAIVILGL